MATTKAKDKPIDNLSIPDKIAKARTQLLLNRKYVFWATVGMYQNLVEVKDNPAINTMATDGRNLYYNPEFVASLTNDELMFVFAHEAGHCALNHHFRRGHRDVKGWNVACDFALNQILVDSGFPLLKNALLDKQFEGMSAEEIYPKIKVTYINALTEGWDVGAVMDDPKNGTAEGENNKKQWEVIVRQAAEVAKGQGHLPGNFEYLVEPIQQKLDLHSMLKHLMSVAQADDYSWARPSRKHVWQGVYLPSLYTESVGDILVAIDISGSISQQQAAKFLGVVNLVLSDLKPNRVHFIQCDAAVQHHQEFRGGEVLPSKVGIKGGGGTDMRPIWKWVEDEGKNLSCAVVCSDFCMSPEDFGVKQQFPVLWVTCTKGGKAPWGLSVELEDAN